MIAIAAAALLLQATPAGGELMERLQSPVRATFESQKRSYDLEVCVADALTVMGSPTVLRDGPENIVIAASFPGGNAFLASVSISRNGTGSHLELRLRGKAWADRMKTRIAACL